MIGEKDRDFLSVMKIHNKIHRRENMDKIKLEQIKLNFKYKNLRELCEVTGMEYKDSTNSRESIRKELRRYIELKRVGRGYIITEIYDKPKKRLMVED